jgi:hypothetical protein
MEQQDHLEPELGQDELQAIAGGGDNSTAAAIGAVGAGLVGAKIYGGQGQRALAQQVAQIAEHGLIKRPPPPAPARVCPVRNASGNNGNGFVRL